MSSSILAGGHLGLNLPPLCPWHSFPLVLDHKPPSQITAEVSTLLASAPRCHPHPRNSPLSTGSAPGQALSKLDARRLRPPSQTRLQLRLYLLWCWLLSLGGYVQCPPLDCQRWEGWTPSPFYNPPTLCSHTQERHLPGPRNWISIEVT